VSRRGFTLLETMIALVILAAVGTAVLQVVGGTARTARDLAMWSEAVAAAENGLVLATLETRAPTAFPPLPQGFTQRVQRRTRGGGLVEITVTIGLPDGRSFELSRLVLAGS